MQEKHHPLVSVVMPVYNGAKVVAQAIDSVLIQSVDCEVIIIDDASPEDLMPVLKPYLERPDIRYYRNQKNLGVAGSRNRGVRMARGEYVAFLDCDDWWEPDKLSKQLERMDQTGTVLCCTGRRFVTFEGEKTDQIVPVKEILTYRDLLWHNAINCSSVLMKKDVAAAFPMEHDECHEDYLTWLKILKQYGKASAVNEPLLCYRLSGGKSKSGNKLKSAKMTYQVYRLMGFGTLKSLLCFAAYAFHGVSKYYLSELPPLIEVGASIGR